MQSTKCFDCIQKEKVRKSCPKMGKKVGQIGKNDTANWKHNFKIKKTIWIPKQAYEIKVYSIWHVSLKYKVVDKVTFIA